MVSSVRPSSGFLLPICHNTYHHSLLCVSDDTRLLWSETDSCITMVTTVIMSLCSGSVIFSQTFSVYNIAHTSMWFLYSCEELLFTKIFSFLQKCSSDYTLLLVFKLPCLLIPVLKSGTYWYTIGGSDCVS